MMILVIGGSGSGKSDYAEKLVEMISKEHENVQLKSKEKAKTVKKYYLATMQVFDEEGLRKVERHRRLRSGKGFITIEQPVQIHGAIEKMEAGKGVALLECISNLAANEMFSGTEPKGEEQVGESILTGITHLKEKVTHLVVVSNNVFEDGIVYDEMTMEYIRGMGKLNQRLAMLADQVVEVVAGIPVIVKKQEK